MSSHRAAVAVSTPVDGTIVASCRLLALSDDEVGVVAHELCDPLRPLLAVHLSSTAKGLRTAMQPALAELRLQRQAAEAFAAHCGSSTAGLRDVSVLRFGALYLFSIAQHFGGPLSLAHWRTLGHLVGCRSLPRLEGLFFMGFDNGDEGAALLAAGLRRGGLPSLKLLSFEGVQLGDQGAAALATALTKRTLPALVGLDLIDSQIGDAGLVALAPVVRQLPNLDYLSLDNNLIGDRGLASLLAEPVEGALPSLRSLYLFDNQITDSGCAKLASALRGGALPNLDECNLTGNPGEAAQEAVHAVLNSRRAAGDTEGLPE